ncbi:MAG: hypothetical protein ACJAY6_001814, partial [Yoonia sp.]
SANPRLRIFTSIAPSQRRRSSGKGGSRVSRVLPQPLFTEKMKFFEFPRFSHVLRRLAAGSFAYVGSYRNFITLLISTNPYILGYPQTYPQEAVKIPCEL